MPNTSSFFGRKISSGKRLELLLASDFAAVAAVLFVVFLLPYSAATTAVALIVIGLSGLLVLLPVLLETIHENKTADVSGTTATDPAALAATEKNLRGDFRSLAEYVDKCEKHTAAALATLTANAAAVQATLETLKTSVNTAAAGAASSAANNARSPVFAEISNQLAVLSNLGGDDGDITRLRSLTEEIQAQLDNLAETARALENSVRENTTAAANAAHAAAREAHAAAASAAAANAAANAAVVVPAPERDGPLPPSLMAKAFSANHHPPTGGAVGRLIGKAAAHRRPDAPRPHHADTSPVEDEVWDTAVGMEENETASTATDTEDNANFATNFADDNDAIVGNADNNDADADTNAVPENNADFDDDNDFIGDFDDDNDAPDANENTNPYANVPTTAYAPDDNDTFSDNDDNDDDVFPANNAPPRAYPAAAPAFTPPPAPPPPPPPPPPPAPAPPPRAPRATPTRATVAKPDDELLQKARALVFTERQASTPLLQRRLAVSYGQAAELIAALEAHGDIGPDRGPGLPREVLRHSNAHQHPQQHQPHPQPPPHPHQHPQPAAHPQPPSPQPAAHTHAPDADRRSLPQASVTPISTTAFSPTVSVTASAAALVSGAPAQTDLLSQLGLAPEVPTPKHRHAARKRTVLIANVLTGLDEKPYVRGTGPGLNEHIGVPMEPAGIGRWQWVAPDDAHPVRATVWKNDTYPDADGATDILPGEIREITPDFRN